MGTALVFLAAYAWQVIGRVVGSGADWLETVMWLTWASSPSTTRQTCGWPRTATGFSRTCDMYPVTSIGRSVAAALMMSGIAVLGVVTASIASWLVQRVEESAEAAAESAEEPVRVELGELVAEIAALRREIAELKDRRGL
jgi:hypothetical protein